MQNYKLKDIIILSLKVIAIVTCLLFIAENYFFEIVPSAISPIFILSFAALIALNWYTKAYKKTGYFKIKHIPLIVIPLFFAVHFRASFLWASNTYPLRDANMVMLTLQEPFDDFAYMMMKQYLSSTILPTFAITVILTIFLYTIFRNTTKRLFAISVYFLATIASIFCNIPILDYIHILSNEPEKNTSYSKFFVENYINPDSVKIAPPSQKRNLILIYLESMETSFMDKKHGGNQDVNLIPEITNLALQNLSFGKQGNTIGGGFDIFGSTSTFTTTHTRTLGIPNVTIYSTTPVLRHYKSLYKILNEAKYHQVFFQGNPGLFKEFQSFVVDHKMDEVYGPDDLIKRLNIDTTDLIKRHGYKTVQDKEAFAFATNILDTISEPFSLTFFTIDTHSPFGIYDPECVKATDENNEEEQLKATIRCVSRELNSFLDSLKRKPFYDNTTIIVFGDHRFMGTSLIKNSPQRKWINFFVNSAKQPALEENRFFSDIDMFPTILSAMNYNIDGDRLGFGIDLFSNKKTLVEIMGLDSLNKEIKNISGHLKYESYRLQKDLNNP